MRITGGEFGGRRLVAPRGWKVRPTSDRAREAIFSTLGERVSGARVLDLFCGTGALALDALSRGAASAVLVDRDTRPALGNVEMLGLGERVQLVRADVSRWLAGAATTAVPHPGKVVGAEFSPPAVGHFDLVFVDAPYKLAARVKAPLENSLPALLAPDGRAVVESAAGRPLRLETLESLRQRRYGAADVSIYRRRGE